MTSFSVRPLCEPRYCLTQLPRYDQVLTGILPYDGSDGSVIAWRIRHGARPSRPTDPTQNRWLPDPVWDVITTSWSHKPEHRCELPVVYRAFSTSSQQDVESVEPGDSTTRNGRGAAMTEGSWPLKQADRNVESSSQGSLLSSSSYGIRNLKCKGVLMKWIRRVLSPPTRTSDPKVNANRSG